MKRSTAQRQRFGRPRLPVRKGSRLPLPATSREPAAGGSTIRSILKLFVLVCVLSLLLTIVLFYLVTHRPEMLNTSSTEPPGANHPLPVEVGDVKHQEVDKRSVGVEIQVKPGPGVDSMESIILSKMLEGRPGMVPAPGTHTVQPPVARAPPKNVDLHDSPFHRPSPPVKVEPESKFYAVKHVPPPNAQPLGKSKPVALQPNKLSNDKLKDAIIKDLAPKEHLMKEAAKAAGKDKKTPAPLHDNKAVKPSPPPVHHDPPPPAHVNNQPSAHHPPTHPPPHAPTPAPTPPSHAQPPRPSPRPHPVTPAPPKPKTSPPPPPPPPPKQPQPPRPQPPPAPAKPHIPTPAPRVKGPPVGLPVVQHGSRDPPPVPASWQERASLQDIENFIFSTTPIVNFSLHITEDAIENFQVALPQTIPNFRAPCWLEEVPVDHTYDGSMYKCHINFRRISKGFDFMESVLLHRQMQGKRWRTRCMPAFYLIGVLKSGTTDMYEALMKHPNIMQPEIKEPEYWSRQRFQISSWLFKKDCVGERKTVRFSEYLDIYDKPSEAVRLSMNKRSDGSIFSDVIFGDFSTHTFVEIVGWDKTLDAPRYISAHHIHQMAPESKFILMLRDPVERAYSRYKMRFARRQNVQGTAAEFHLRMLREVKDTLECMKSSSRRFCVYKENFGREGYHTMLAHGLYTVYLNDWLSIIPRDQLYVVRFEDYISDRLEYVEDIAYFLGLGSFPENLRREIETMPVPNPSTTIGDMMDETKLLLREFYKPFNHELADILHDTRYKWGY